MNDVFVDKVLNREIDGAFVAESPERKELNELFIRKDKLVFVTSTQEEISDIWELLKTAPVITFPEGSIFRRRLELLLASHGIISPSQMIILNSLGAQMVNITSGLGVGYLPESIIGSYAAQGLMKRHTLEEADLFSELDITFIYRKDHIMDAAFRYFLEKVENAGR
jgi:DNA-binding transcriptional LysR family regulator